MISCTPAATVAVEKAMIADSPEGLAALEAELGRIDGSADNQAAEDAGRSMRNQRVPAAAAPMDYSVVVMRNSFSPPYATLLPL